ncbi:MAG: dehydrogenase/reductase SDR family protein 12 [Halioglobus sp.]|jgi:dehydrogenase/reductase SDR family protein 12
MTVLQETVDVARPIDEVFAYVSDFTTTREWDATAIRARKLTLGKIAEGTEFEVVCALPVGSIKLIYKIEELKHNKRFVLSGRSRFFDIRDTITFSPSQRGTIIEYSAEFFFKPMISSVASISNSGLERMGKKSVAGLALALEDKFPLALKKKSRGERLLPELSLFTRLGYHLSQKHFHPMSASVKGKHMVITGASAGLGYVTARELGRRGAELTLVMRDKIKAEKTVKALQLETGNTQIGYELADLSLMSNVDRLIARLKKSGRAIDVLINNAGALFNPRGETAEGLEQSYALLLLSPYRLTEGLKPLLLKAEAARVINVVSGGMYSQKLDVDTLLNKSDADYSGSTAYAKEKRALMVLTQEWSRDWADQGIVVNAMHPGWADTPGVQQALPLFRKITRSALRTPEQGADTIVWMAVATEAAQATGKLFLDRQERPTHLMRSTHETPDERRKLVDFMAQASLASV